MKRKILFLCSVVCLLAILSPADEGMWLFNRPPNAKMKAKYGFEPTQAWLNHVRLSSVRFNNGGSGSFVSVDGLAFTNHHVGAECIQQISTKEKDYMKLGFYAKTQAAEAKCPDLELNVLQEIEDVTAQVEAAAKPGMAVADVGRAQRAVMSQLEQDCAQKTKMRCDVVTLYAGGMYNLYKYKKYTDVRLVFAPEFHAAFFGGDPDNFEYPRYDLDITFFRVYENNKPVHLDNYFKWAKVGVTENDLIFVSGHPGRTDRLLAMSQLEFMRDVSYPFNLKMFRSRIDALKAFAGQSEDNARIAQEDIFGYENSYKAISGEEEGLRDPKLMAQKEADEKKLRDSVNADTKKKAEYGGAWDNIAAAMKVNHDIFVPVAYVERRAGYAGTLANYARILVRAAEEKKKPNADRLREFRDSALPSLEQSLFSTAPIYKSLETLLLGTSLKEMQQGLGADNDVVKKTLSGKSPAEVAKAMIEGTKLDQVDVRKQLYEGGEAAIAASTDPLIVMMRSVEPDARALRKKYDDEVDAVVRANSTLIAKARFAVNGYNDPPDATFTLRLSYGAVKGYEQDGKRIPYFTTIGGAFQHAAEHGNKDPFELPKSWMEAKPRLNLNTPLNFVSTADIIGGNSGSPTVNKAGEVVGIVFDGNIQSLPWDYIYDDVQGRSVHVDSRGIIEALKNIYHADALANELTGRATKPAVAGKAAGLRKEVK